MLQPKWNTSSGSIGAYVEGTAINFQFSAVPSATDATLQYSVLNGQIPAGLSLSSSGLLSGTLAVSAITYTNNFTIRLKQYRDNVYVGFSDKSFSITVSGESVPRFTTVTGNLGTFNDCTWISVTLNYQSLDKTADIKIDLIDGELPPGLQLNSNGTITGYAEPPLNSNNQPTAKTYSFVLKISSDTQFSTTPFTITVVNQRSVAGFTARKPAIFNLNRPITVTEDDEYYSYYLSTADIGTYYQNTPFKFKLIGHEFGEQNIQYHVSGLSGVGTLTYDSTTGWISGNLPTVNNNLLTVNISAYVSNGSLNSDPINLKFVVKGNISTDIAWDTSSDLGIITNGEISTLGVRAVSLQNLPLTYTLVSGTLPRGLSLLLTGEIAGRVAFEPTSSLQAKNSEIIYTFTIKASSTTYSFVQSTKEFTLTTKSTHAEPYHNIYIQAYTSTADRELFDSLINDENIFPETQIFRINDNYHSKTRNIIYNHMFGVSASTINQYLEAVAKNHYKRRVTLGDIKTAVAKDTTGKIIYEVVYSEIVDNLVNNNNISVSKQLMWPQQIKKSTVTVYPASLVNMRRQILSSLGSVNDNSVLPLWMRSIQSDGSTTGLISAFVICYAKPGYSEIIKNNIKKLWPHTLNEIQFTVDRFIIDRSFTYEFNPLTDSWTTLPSSVTNTDDNNVGIIFKNNILQ